MASARLLSRRSAGFRSRCCADFEVLGTRAPGMGGAFVAVADDASAAYWNPAGLALGAVFQPRARPAREGGAGCRCGRTGRQSVEWSLVASALPALGLAYYRLRTTTSLSGRPGPTTRPSSKRSSPTTPGRPLVQSSSDHIAVGATAETRARRRARSVIAPAGDRDDLLDEADDLTGVATNKFDADVGVIATAGTFVRASRCATSSNTISRRPSGSDAELERQARAGVAVTLAPDGSSWRSDFDLDTRAVGPSATCETSPSAPKPVHASRV